MKYIKKLKEPSSLVTHRLNKINQNDLTYENLPSAVKNDINDFLLEEQKYICCYCMSRISREKMRIEHWDSRSEFSDSHVIYSNLLGACTGNEGADVTHCDVHRGSIPLKINPTSAICEQQIKFKFVSGEIDSNDDDIKKDINETLNLNYERLVKNRKATFDDWLKRFSQLNPQGTWTKPILQKELEKWENDSLTEYRPYCQIVIAYLKDKIKKAS